jgi:hypothetical protein
MLDRERDGSDFATIFRFKTGHALVVATRPDGCWEEYDSTPKHSLHITPLKRGEEQCSVLSAC